MATDSESAVSGGLLVVLGIIVAIAIGFVLFNMNDGGIGADTAPDVSINTTLPGDDAGAGADTGAGAGE